MANTFTFELVSPERLLVSETVSEVVVPGADGEMTILADHSPVMTTIKPGIVSVTLESGGQEKYVVFGGFADVLPSGCTLLAESATHVDDINREEIEQRIRDAKEDLEATESHEEMAKLTDYLDQLTTLQGAVLPA